MTIRLRDVLTPTVTCFQFCPVASPLRGFPSYHTKSVLPSQSSVLNTPLSSFPIDASARNRLPAPQNAVRTQQTTRSDAPPMMSEIDGRVDQLALVQDTLLNGATPTPIAGFAMIIAQIQAQATYSDVSLTITSRVGPIERSATFRDGAWHGYDLTHSLIDPRSHLVFGEPTRPPMDQERSLRISQSAVQTPTTTPLPSPLPVQFSCTLPMVPPPVLTPPMPLASDGIRLLTTQTSNFMLPSAFQGGGVQVDNTTSTTLSEEQPRESRPARTVTFKDSYEELIQSSSRTEPQVSGTSQPCRLPDGPTIARTPTRTAES